MIPPIYQFILLTLVAYRVWRLIAEDDILERPRRWFLRLPRDWDGDERTIPKRYRNEWALFLICPWCAGAWVSLGVYIGWLLTEGSTPDSASDVAVGIGIWLAISCVVGLIRSKLDPPE